MFETVDQYLQKRLEQEFAKHGRTADAEMGADMVYQLQDAGYGIYPDEPAWNHTYFLEERIKIQMDVLKTDW